jgi:hypothetical protein
MAEADRIGCVIVTLLAIGLATLAGELSAREAVNRACSAGR